jgi:hypothetical protein
MLYEEPYKPKSPKPPIEKAKPESVRAKMQSN